MEVGTYLRIIARYWWVVLLVMLAAGGAAGLLDSVRARTYSTQARVAAGPASVITDERTIVDLMGQMGSRQIIGTLAQSFTSSEVQAAARKAAGLTDAEAGNYSLEANVLPDTSVIQVTGSGPNPDTLANYINATVAATVANAHNVYKVVDLRPLEQAHVPVNPSSPVPSRDIPLGVGLGFALGILLALALDYLFGSRGVRSELRALHPYYNQEVGG